MTEDLQATAQTAFSTPEFAAVVEKLQKLKESEEAKALEEDLAIVIDDLQKYVVISDSPYEELEGDLKQIEDAVHEEIEADLEQ